MNEFLHDARIISSPGEGTGETVERGPILKVTVGDTLFDLGTIQCCDVANGMDLQHRDT